MYVHLLRSRPPDGDSIAGEIPPLLPDSMRVPRDETQNLVNPPPLNPSPRLPGPPHTQNFIPLEFRQRLRSILSRTPNPHKSLDRFRSKFAELLPAANPTIRPSPPVCRDPQIIPPPCLNPPPCPTPPSPTRVETETIEVEGHNPADSVASTIKEMIPRGYEGQQRRATVSVIIAGGFSAPGRTIVNTRGNSAGDYHCLIPLPPDPGGPAINSGHREGTPPQFIDNNKIVSNTTTDSNDNAAPAPPPKKQWKRIAWGEGEVPSSGKLEQDSADAAAAKQLTKAKDQSSLAPAVGGSVLSKRKEPAVLVQYNKASLIERKKKKGEDAATEAVVSDGDPRKDGGKEAASPGATGILTGASDSACQEP